MAQLVDIELQRNEVLTLDYALKDADGGTLDITGATFALDVMTAAGVGGSPIASATVTILDPALGIIAITLDGSDFAAVDGAMEIVRLAYDLIMTLEGTPSAVMRGGLILVPGVS